MPSFCLVADCCRDHLSPLRSVLRRGFQSQYIPNHGKRCTEARMPPQYLLLFATVQGQLRVSAYVEFDAVLSPASALSYYDSVILSHHRWRFRRSSSDRWPEARTLFESRAPYAPRWAYSPACLPKLDTAKPGPISPLKCLKHRKPIGLACRTTIPSVNITLSHGVMIIRPFTQSGVCPLYMGCTCISSHPYRNAKQTKDDLLKNPISTGMTAAKD
ncbi:hypothetical protein ASPVEDRAFT_448538 [Aspergillus versicolor CBS 583.65]|uniref:Uncharacterized protein n=1 Tax=Aspergillus versicolor CBS 583.65 TaxID=1036611 RepID=A0A1L9P9N2_ASPVE|nr:uncharacterized protein ASPVEDRAFT_448538 [Aspergillus versicolor CBS 583.65]OJI98182.1 hypothetical protein ASPVEDRAFT_448538 [Aspergillus versicolor CBS 583.65]